MGGRGSRPSSSNPLRALPVAGHSDFSHTDRDDPSLLQWRQHENGRLPARCDNPSPTVGVHADFVRIVIGLEAREKGKRGPRLAFVPARLHIPLAFELLARQLVRIAALPGRLLHGAGGKAPE